MFDLVGKVVVEVQRSSIFSVIWVHHMYRKLEVCFFFLIFSYFFMNSWFSLKICSDLCYGETRELHA